MKQIVVPHRACTTVALQGKQLSTRPSGKGTNRLGRSYSRDHTLLPLHESPIGASGGPPISTLPKNTDNSIPQCTEMTTREVRTSHSRRLIAGHGGPGGWTRGPGRWACRSRALDTWALSVELAGRERRTRRVLRLGMRVLDVGLAGARGWTRRSGALNTRVRSVGHAGPEGWTRGSWGLDTRVCQWVVAVASLSRAVSVRVLAGRYTIRRCSSGPGRVRVS